MWWTYAEGTNGLTYPTATDLLAGSGLNVVGATIRRVMCFQMLSATRQFSHRVPSLRQGITVAASPPATNIETPSLNSVDWYWLAESNFAPIDAAASEQVFIWANDRSGHLDVAVNRVLDVGESVWLLTDVIRTEVAQPVATRILARTLVTLPAL